MSLRTRRFFACLLSLVMIAWSPAQVWATTYVWNATGTGVGGSDGAGTWNTSLTDWSAGGNTAVVAWPNLTTDTAVFGSYGTGGTITVAAGGINVGNITTNFGTTGTGYTFSGGTITVGAGGVLTNNNSALTTTYSSAITSSGAVTVDGWGATAINGGVTATSLTKFGRGALTVTGGAGALSLGSGTLTDNVGALNLTFNASANDLVVNTANLVLAGTAVLTVTGNGSLTQSQTFASTTINPGYVTIATVDAASGLTLNLGPITHNAGIVAFSVGANTTIKTDPATPLTNGIVGGWAYFGATGGGFATVNNVTGVLSAVGGTVANLTSGAASNALFTPTSFLPITGSHTVNSWTMGGGGGVLNMINSSLTIGTGGWANNGNNSATTVLGGTVTSGGSTMYVWDYTANNTSTYANQFTDNGATSVGLTLRSGSTLNLIPLTANTYTGPTTIAGGVITLTTGLSTTSADALGNSVGNSTNSIVLAGGALNLTATGITNRTLVVGAGASGGALKGTNTSAWTTFTGTIDFGAGNANVLAIGQDGGGNGVPSETIVLQGSVSNLNVNPISVRVGTLALNNSGSTYAVGIGGLTLDNSITPSNNAGENLIFLGNEQINPSAPLTLLAENTGSSNAIPTVNLLGHTQTIGGGLNFTDYGAFSGGQGVLTGPGGKLILNSTLTIVANGPTALNTNGFISTNVGGTSVTAVGGSGYLDLNGLTRTISIESNSGTAQNVTIDTIVQNGGINLIGNRGLILNNVNTYAGGTTVGTVSNTGATTLIAKNSSALGTGTVTLNAGTELGVGTSSAVNIANAITLGGAGVTFSPTGGSGAIISGPINAGANAFNVNLRDYLTPASAFGLTINSAITGSNTMTVSSVAAATFTLTNPTAAFTGNIALGTNVTLALPGLGVPGGTTVYGNTITGTPTGVNLGAAAGGITQLTATNSSYTGITTLTAGALAANPNIVSVTKLADGLSNSSIGASSNVAANLVFGATSGLQYVGTSASTTNRLFTVAASGTVYLDASGTTSSNTVGFTNAGTIAYTAAAQTTTFVFTGSNTGANTFNPILANDTTGVTSVTKQGAGAWSLTGNNTFTGTITADAGSLLFDFSSLGTVSLPADAVVFGAGNTFGGGSLQFKAQSSGTTALTLGTVLMNANSSNNITLTPTGANNMNLTIGAITNGSNNPTLHVDLTAGSASLKTQLAAGTYNWLTVADATGIGFGVSTGAGSVITRSALGGTPDLGTSGNVNTNDYKTPAGALQLDALTPAAANTLAISTGTSLDLNGNALTLTKLAAGTGAGIVMNSSSPYLIQDTAGGGKIDASAGSLLTIQQLGSGTLTISAAFGSNVAALVKGGSGNLTLSGAAAAYVNATPAMAINANAGTLVFDESAIAGPTNNTNAFTGFANVQITNSSGNVFSLSGGNVNYVGAITSNSGELSIGNGVSTSTTLSATAIANNGSALDLAIGPATTLTIAANITGSGALNINGGAAAKVILTGTSAVGGTTTISSGNTLQIGSATTGTLGTQSVVDNGTLTFGRTNSFTFANAVSGTGGVTQNGALGTTILSGVNSYQGVTTVTAGTLSVGLFGNGGSLTSNLGQASNVAASIVINGGTLQYTGSGETSNRLFTFGSGATTTGFLDASGTGALNLNNTGAIVNGSTAAGTLTLTGTNTGSNTLAAAFSDVNPGVTNNAITKTGTGTWVLSGTNTYSGVTTITAGILQVASNSNLGGSAAPITFNGGTLSTTGALTTSGAITVSNASAINTNGNTITFGGLVTSSAGLDIQGTGTVALIGNTTAGSSTWTVNTGKLQVGNGTTAGVLGAIPVAGNGTLSFQNPAAASLTASGAIGGFTNVAIAGGSGSTVILTGADTATGTTTINANNTLQIGNGTTTGTLTASPYIFDSGSLVLQPASGGSITLKSAILGTGSVSTASPASGTSTVTFTQYSTYVGGTSIAANTTAVIGSANALLGTGTITIASGGTLAVNPGGFLPLANLIAGAGNVTFSTSGTTAYPTGANTYTGTTSIITGANGTATVFVTTLNNVANPLASSSFGRPTTSGNATITLGASNAGTGANNEVLSYIGSGETTDRIILLSESANNTGGTTTAQILSNGAGPLALTGAVNSSTIALSNITLGLGGAFTGGVNTLSGVIGSSTGTTNLLAQAGGALWALTNTSPNTYNGTTNLAPNTSYLQLGNGGAGAGSLPVGSVVGMSASGAANLIFYRSDALAFSNVISGATGILAVVQNGTGTTTLTGASTYSGATTVNAGTLTLDLNAGGSITNAAKPLAVGGGTFDWNALAGSATGQTFTGTTLNPGASQIITTSTGGASSGTLALTAITRTTGSTVDFSNSANNLITTTTLNSSNGILGGYATFGGSDWAVTGAAGTNPVTAFSGYISDTWAGTNNTTVTTSSAPASGSTTNSLRFNSPGGAFTVTLAGANTITTGGILVTSTVGNNASLITNGTSLTTGANDLIVIQNDLNVPATPDTSALTIATKITGAKALTKSGVGELILSGPNDYTGNTYLNGGITSVSDLELINVASGLGKVASNAATGLQFNGGTLKYTGSGGTPGTTDRLFSLNVQGGTIDSSGTGPVVFNNTGAMAYTGTYFSTTLNLTGSNTGANTIAAVIANNTGGNTTLNKTGAGTWVLAGANTYRGATNVSTGSLLLGTGGSNANSAVGVTGTATYGMSYTTSGGTIAGGSTLNLAGTATLNLQDGFYNTLAFNGPLLGSGTLAGTFGSGATLGFDIGATAGTNDKLTLAGTASITGTPTFNYADPNGVPANGHYVLVTATGGLSGLSNVQTPFGKTFTISSTATEIDLDVTGGGGSATPAISISAGAATRFLAGTTTTGVISGNVTNTGTANYNFTSIVSAGTGSLTSISPQTGTVTFPSGSVGYTATIDGTSATAGTSYTFGTTVTDGSTPASSSTVSLTAVNQRSFNVGTPTIALGRFLISGTPSGTTAISSTGLNAVTANATLGSFTGTGTNGLTLTTTDPVLFNGGVSTQTANYTIGGTDGVAGNLSSASFSSTVAAELGSISNVVVNVTGDAVNQRSFNVGTPTIALGRFIVGATPTGTSAISSTGLNAVTANASLGAFAGTNTGSLTLTTTDPTAFNGATSTQTANYTIGGSVATAGNLSSASFSSPVTAELGSISNVVVNLTGDALNNRAFTLTGANGRVLQGSTVTGTNLVSNTADNLATRVNLVGGSSVTSGGVTVTYTGASTVYDGSTTTSAPISFNFGNTGVTSGSIDLASGGTPLLTNGEAGSVGATVNGVVSYGPTTVVAPRTFTLTPVASGVLVGTSLTAALASNTSDNTATRVNLLAGSVASGNLTATSASTGLYNGTTTTTSNLGLVFAASGVQSGSIDLSTGGSPILTNAEGFSVPVQSVSYSGITAYDPAVLSGNFSLVTPVNTGNNLTLSNASGASRAAAKVVTVTYQSTGGSTSANGISVTGGTLVNGAIVNAGSTVSAPVTFTGTGIIAGTLYDLVNVAAQHNDQTIVGTSAGDLGTKQYLVSTTVAPHQQVANTPESAYLYSGQTYTNLSTYDSATAGVLGHTATIRYINPTGNPTLTFNWNPTPSSFAGNPTAVAYATHLGSDRLDVSGINGQLYVLQMSYDPTKFAPGIADSAIELVYYNTIDAKWEAAVEGNTGGSPAFYDESYDTFLAAKPVIDTVDQYLAANLGAYGTDSSTDQAWAIVNHNSEFAVVPEPSSLVLLAFGALAGFGLWRKKKLVPGSEQA